MFNNPKDIPFAAGMVWGTYHLVRLVPALPRPPLQLVAKLGAAIGLALGVRVGGLLLVCYLGVLLVVSAAWQAAAARRPWLLVEFGLTSLWCVLLPAVLVAYPIMLTCWRRRGSLCPTRTRRWGWRTGPAARPAAARRSPALPAGRAHPPCRPARYWPARAHAPSRRSRGRRRSQIWRSVLGLHPSFLSQEIIIPDRRRAAPSRMSHAIGNVGAPYAPDLT